MHRANHEAANSDQKLLKDIADVDFNSVDYRIDPKRDD